MIVILASLTLAAFGQVPETNYQKIYKMNVLADKKRAVLSLPDKDRVQVWRDHFAYIHLTEYLTRKQKEFLARSLDALAAGELTDELDRESKELFDFKLGQRVFNLGPYTDLGTMCEASIGPRQPDAKGSFVFASYVPFSGNFSSPVPRRFADCDCRQTGTNWGCSSYCTVSSCTPTPDGCSIFYMYPCDGKCGPTRG